MFRHEVGQEPKKSQLDLVITCIFIVAAFSIRLFHLGKLNLLLDEGFTNRMCQLPLADLVKMFIAWGDPNPPLYYIVIKLWTTLFGDSEFSLRFPSVIFSSLSVGLVYRVGLKFSARRPAILAATLISLLPFYVGFAQDARSYALLGMASLISLLYFPLENSWESSDISARENSSHKVFYFFFTACLPLIHVYGVFLILAQNIYRFPFRSKAPSFMRDWWMSMGAIGALCAPWYVSYILHAKQFVVWIDWITTSPTPSFYNFIFSSLGLGTDQDIKVLILLLVVTACGFFLSRKSKSHLRLFVIWIFLSYFIPKLSGSLGYHFLYMRYLSSAGMGVVIFLMAQLDFFLKKSISVFVVATLLLFYFGLNRLEEYFKIYQKPLWQDVIISIQKNDGDQNIASIPATFGADCLRYYIKKTGNEKRLHLLPLDGLEDISSFIRKERSLWVVSTFSFGQIHKFASEDLGRPATSFFATVDPSFGIVVDFYEYKKTAP